MQFQGKTILITGATGGIGKAIVHAFAEQGGNILITDLDDKSGEALAKECGSKALFAPLDVTREEDWVRVFDLAEEKLGGVDVVVNNAGFFKPNVPFEEMPLELWRKHLAINADGVFLGCKHGILRMKSRGGGAIVNIGSGMSISASPTASAYCASKAAVLMTTRTAAASAGPYNIRVNAVLPGGVPTPMLMGNLVEGQSEEQMLDGIRAYSPLGRLATPEDIARAVLFLADSANAAISGVYLPVDGGNMPGA